MANEEPKRDVQNREHNTQRESSWDWRARGMSECTQGGAASAHTSTLPVCEPVSGQMHGECHRVPDAHARRIQRGERERDRNSLRAWGRWCECVHVGPQPLPVGICDENVTEGRNATQVGAASPPPWSSDAWPGTGTVALAPTDAPRPSVEWHAERRGRDGTGHDVVCVLHTNRNNVALRRGAVFLPFPG